jgi:hypothetical protein
MVVLAALHTDILCLTRFQHEGFDPIYIHQDRTNQMDIESQIRTHCSSMVAELMLDPSLLVKQQ